MNEWIFEKFYSYAFHSFQEGKFELFTILFQRVYVVGYCLERSQDDISLECHTRKRKAQKSFIQISLEASQKNSSRENYVNFFFTSSTYVVSSLLCVSFCLSYLRFFSFLINKKRCFLILFDATRSLCSHHRVFFSFFTGASSVDKKISSNFTTRSRCAAALRWRPWTFAMIGADRRRHGECCWSSWALSRTGVSLASLPLCSADAWNSARWHCATSPAVDSCCWSTWRRRSRDEVSLCWKRGKKCDIIRWIFAHFRTLTYWAMAVDNWCLAD